LSSRSFLGYPGACSGEVSLKPREDIIWNRKQKRGRSWDQNETAQHEYAKQQLSCIESEYIKKEWVIDNSMNDIDSVFETYFKNLT
jgi:adenylate kinase family enzyme